MELQLFRKFLPSVPVSVKQPFLGKPFSKQTGLVGAAG